MKPGKMLTLLDEMLRELPDLVGKDGPDWNSLKINYDQPLVHRLWLPWRKDYRINLHRLFPCHPDHALWHPHSWPSAVYVLSGNYTMRQGQAMTRNIRPKPTTTIRMSKGSSYEMTDQLSWHSVAPMKESFTVMLTGPLYENKWTEEDMKRLNLPKLKHNLGGLNKDERRLIRDMVYLLL